MVPAMSPRRKSNVTNVGVRDEVHEAFEHWCSQHDRKLGATVDRLLEWFLRQPPVVRAAVLNDVPGELNEAAAAVLCRLAAELCADTTPAPTGSTETEHGHLSHNSATPRKQTRPKARR
jgi:hypothetical protein